MNRVRCCFFPAIILLLTACGDPRREAIVEPESLPLPIAGEATGPRLTRGPASDVVLSWMETAATGAALRYVVYRDGAWRDARTVVVEPNLFVNWADLPSVWSLGGDVLVAHWLVKRPGGPYAYDIAYSRSANAGRDWQAPITPHTDGTLTQHGFVSLYPHGSHIGLLWLDGRRTDESGDEYSIERGMTVHAVEIDADGTLIADQEVDGLVCSCCPTDAVMTAQGPVAAYRDRSEREIRDIRIAHFKEGVWQQGAIVAKDSWEITACPVNGPKLAANGDTLAVAWFTAPEDQAAAKFALSLDSGATFAEPIVVSASDVRGQVGLTELPNGDFAVSWLEGAASGAQSLRLRRVSRTGKLGNPVTMTESAMTFSTPQLVRFENDLILAWTESIDGMRRIKSARVPVSALP